MLPGAIRQYICHGSGGCRCPQSHLKGLPVPDLPCPFWDVTFADDLAD